MRALTASLAGSAIVEVTASTPDPLVGSSAAGEAIVETTARLNVRVNGEVFVQPKAAIVDVYGRGVVAETWQFFQPLGALGSAGSYAQGDATLQQLSSDGDGGQLGEDNYAEGVANFDQLATSGIGLSGGMGQHDASFSALLSIGSEGSYAQAEGSFAPLQGLAFDELQEPNLASFKQPSSDLYAEGHQVTGEARLEQPSSTLSGRFGAVVRLSGPAHTATLEATFPIIGHARLTQPASSLTASGLAGSIGTAYLAQPRSTLNGSDGWQLMLVGPGHALAVEATFGAVGRAELSQPRTVLTATGGEANYGRASLEQPAGRLGYTGLLVVEQPRTYLVASGGEQVDAPVYVAYAVNLAHFGITEYTNYGFRRIIEFNGEYYGITDQGLYRLSASTDVGTAIASVIETARPDFGSSQDKRVTYSYMLLDTTDTLDVTPVTGERTGYTQQAKGSGRTGKHNRRVQFGRGMKARNWGLRLEHSGEDRFALEEVEFVGEVLRRKVGG